MRHMRLGIAAAIIAAVIFIGFVLSVPHTRDVIQVPKKDSSAASSTPLVTLRDAFKKGLHTITGSVEAPDACTAITASSTLVGDASSTESIRVDISLPVDTGICLQLPTPVDFRVTIAAPEYVPLTATVNGVAASTTAL